MEEGLNTGKSLESFFDRIYVINLPSRPDRLKSICHELSKLGIVDKEAILSVPEAPIFDKPGGFSSKGVRGNFFSHLGIIEDAYQNRFDRILVLEDDAIFRSHLHNKTYQDFILSHVESHDWSMWFPGHLLASQPKGVSKPVYNSTAAFNGAHCYAVHRRGIASLRDYLRIVSERSAGHPEGGKMYIDGALTHFRRQFTDHICLISNPVLSIQKSSDTNLGNTQNSFYDGTVPWVKSFLRDVKDQFWRLPGHV
jgi:glycosyl transferase family 25